jgi:ubiquinone/menaquinone biosynthesis C-methylase UbiE
MATSTVVTQFDPRRYKETTRDQWQAAAEAWHRWTPAIQNWLGPATERMLDLAALGAGDRVLDVAAGAGEPAISAARRVGTSGAVIATDIAPRLLDYAAQAAAAQGLKNVTTQVVDGENLTFPDGSFDVVTSRVGLIYFPDQQRALGEMRRVLAPGGRIAAMVYATAETNPFFSIPVGIIRRRAQLPPPAPGMPGPFSLGGDGVLAEAFQRAGFRNVVTEYVDAPLRLTSAAECVRFEQESFGALHQMMSGLSEAERAETWAEIAEALHQFAGPEGFVGPCQMIIGVGTR